MRCEERWSGGARSGADDGATGACIVGCGGRSMFWMEAEEDAACRHTASAACRHTASSSACRHTAHILRGMQAHISLSRHADTQPPRHAGTQACSDREMEEEGGNGERRREAAGEEEGGGCRSMLPSQR
jgi:hypothetical protein